MGNRVPGEMALPRMSKATRAWRWMAVAASVVIAVVVFGAPGPKLNLRSAIASHDFGHVVAFGVVTALFAFAIGARSRADLRRRVGATFLAAGAAVALGAVVELAQAVRGLHGDPWDVVRDAGGALSVALIVLAVDSSISRSSRLAMMGVAFSVLVAFSYPTLAALSDESRARTQFPVLASFKTVGELSRFHFGEGLKPKIIPMTDDKGRFLSAVQLRLPAGKYPGFELRYFPGDWRGMRALELLIVNPESTPIEMTVRIDDSEYRFYLDDRYNQSFPLSPGVNRIEIPLSDVVAAPHDREFDMRRVHSLLVYTIDLKQPRNIIVGPIKLLH